MNIKEAKKQVVTAIKAYLAKDEFGNYLIPIEAQRPVFLMGPPGIGKTAIMKQTANELGIGFVSYSMTHHTRQSALGLPYIEHKNFGGREYAVSEYTMSEIIASVYENMEATGYNQGILFLDEINCVSETLAPAMLLFLQYKEFGQHRVPDGWIVVTAGNPPEYNKSVREFDIVTWDRLKRIDVEPDMEAWKEYAYVRLTHPAIMCYLESKKSNFYLIESTVDGKQFVTARGWSDLSDMMRVCENLGEPVDEQLIRQYIQNPKIAKDFAVYYDLFRKYRSDYEVDKIVAGKESKAIRERARKAKFDEMLSLLGLLLDVITPEMKNVIDTHNVLSMLTKILREMKTAKASQKVSFYDDIISIVGRKREELNKGKSSGKLSVDDQIVLSKLISVLDDLTALVAGVSTRKAAFDAVREEYNIRVSKLREKADETVTRLNNIFRFIAKVYSDGQEMLILVTELTINHYSAVFINRFGCEEYFKYNKSLMVYDRVREITEELDKLDLD